jgi:hypothetical protein
MRTPSYHHHQLRKRKRRRRRRKKCVLRVGLKVSTAVEGVCL